MSKQYIRNEYKNASPRRKAQLNEATKRWRKKNKDKVAIWHKKERQKEGVKVKRKDKFLREHYGMTYEKYLEMLKDQNYVCAICGQEETRLSRSKEPTMLSVDHCHKTGEIRGLLCAKCNYGLGSFMDNINNLLSAAKYLEKNYE